MFCEEIVNAPNAHTYQRSVCLIEFCVFELEVGTMQDDSKDRAILESASDLASLLPFCALLWHQQNLPHKIYITQTWHHSETPYVSKFEDRMMCYIETSNASSQKGWVKTEIL